jgi:hypothetical protein
MLLEGNGMSERVLFDAVFRRVDEFSHDLDVFNSLRNQFGIEPFNTPAG